MNKLKDPLLLKYIIEEKNKEFAGMDSEALVMLLKISLRNVKNAEATSSNVLISDKTGKGKDKFTRGMCSIMLQPEKTSYHRTHTSSKTFNYWQPKKKVGKKFVKISWDGKVIYLEDPEEEILKEQAFKVLASGGTHMTVVKDQNVLDRKIDGKPVIIVTSMKTQIDIEGQRRWSILSLEGKNIIGTSVIRHILNRKNGVGTKQADNTFRAMLQKQDRQTVTLHDKIPFLYNMSPEEFEHKYNITYTALHKLIDYAFASAVLHQEQRKRNPKGHILTEEFDLIYGCYAWLKFGDCAGVASNQAEKKILEILSKRVQDKKEPRDYMFITELQKESGFSRYILKHKLQDAMQEKGLITVSTEFNPDAGYSTEAWSIPTKSVSTSSQEAFVKALKKQYPKGVKQFNKVIKEISKLRQANNLPKLEDF